MALCLLFGNYIGSRLNAGKPGSVVECRLNHDVELQELESVAADQRQGIEHLVNTAGTQTFVHVALPGSMIGSETHDKEKWFRRFEL